VGTGHSLRERELAGAYLCGMDIEKIDYFCIGNNLMVK
jgi:hypothetical protein